MERGPISKTAPAQRAAARGRKGRSAAPCRERSRASTANQSPDAAQDAFFKWAGIVVEQCDGANLVLRHRGRGLELYTRVRGCSWESAQRRGLDGIFRAGVFYRWRGPLREESK